MGRTENPLPTHLLGALLHGWTWRMAWRDSRTQRKRLLVFSFSIVAGIAALVAIHSLKSSVENGINAQAKTLLGSDLQISSRKAFPAGVVQSVATRAQALSREVSVSSMMAFPKGGVRLVQVRAFEGDYPFYGRIQTTPADAWTRFQRGEPGVLLEPALLDQFEAKIGEHIRLGALELPILGVLSKGAPGGARFSGFAPQAYVRLAELEKAGLLGTSSLAVYRLHLKLGDASKKAESAAAVATREIRAQFTDSNWQFETPESRRDSLGDALDNFQQFLGILATAALVLGAIGVAGAIHAHVSRRVPTVAILRCLGCPGDLAFGIYLVQAIALGVLGAMAGALLGVGLHAGVVAAFRESLPVALELAPRFSVVLQTTAAGFLVCCGFALLPLLRVRDISPAATLREGAGAGRHRLASWTIYGVLVLLLTLLGALDGSHWLRSLAMTGGLLVAFALLAATARLFIFLTKRGVRPTWNYLLRQGISNIHRPHNQTLLFLLSLGLGTFLLLTILLARNGLLSQLRGANVAERPSVYLVDVQADQLDGVRALLKARGIPELESAPIVTMRIQSIKGVPVRELLQNDSPMEAPAAPPEKKARRNDDGAIPKWVLLREYRSSYRARLSPTETLVAGEWFDHAPEGGGPVPVSLESEIAKDLRVTVGDEMVLDVQGEPVRARVASLRKVDWSRFSLNFFMTFPPGVLESAPGFHVITARVPGSSGELQRALVRDFPNISAIDLSLILETVGAILEKIGRVIQILAGFTVLAGMPILIGTLLNGRDQRVRESVLLRTLGASSRQVRVILLVEYATLGALSAASGIGLALLANAALATWVFKTSPVLDGPMVLSTFAIACALSLGAGAGLSRGVCQRSPLEILRAG